uniref:HAT C-terminal dimerisation domain-containing protein n=1 Tax=Panagrolaimus sp. PS1159 TaxID=55785 RepID=A0AC35GSS2_9BILA
MSIKDDKCCNFYLNQIKKCPILVPVQSYSKSNNEKHSVSDKYKEKGKLQSWNKSFKAPSFTTLNENNDDLKKPWKNKNNLNATNKSTISLHIAAYENSNEAVALDLFNDENTEGLRKRKFGSIKTSEQCFTHSLKSLNPFEFTRQQSGDRRNEPEVMHFSASQQLLESQPSTASQQFENNDVNFVRPQKATAEIKKLIDENKCEIKECKKNVGSYQVFYENACVALQCSHCFGLFSTNTRTHLKTHVTECAEGIKARAPYSLTDTQRKDMAMKLVDFVATDQRSFTTTQTEAFKNLINYVSQLSFNIGRNLPSFTAPVNLVPCERTIKNTMKKYVNDRFEQIKKFLQDNNITRCSVILDYTSLVYQYLGIVLQFIHNWELKSFLLAVEDVDESTTAANIKETVKAILQKYGLNIDYQFFVTDEGANVLCAFRDVSSSVCICHTLATDIKRTTNPYKATGRNTIAGVVIAQNVLDTVIHFQSNLDKLKQLIAGIRHSTKISTKLSSRLIIDCETRWASKLIMVDGWLNLKREDLEQIKEFYKNNVAKTKLIRDVVELEGDFRSYIMVMALFKEKIRLLEAQKKPTSNHVLLVYFDLEDHLSSFLESENNLVKSLAVSALAVLRKKENYFKKSIFYAACSLDIYKRAKIFKCRGASEAAKAQEETKLLLNEFLKIAYPEDFVPPADIVEDDDDYAMLPGQEAIPVSESLVAAAENELLQYFQYKPNAEERAMSDVLQFWKSNEHKFPYVSKLAQVILAIPAASASIEREFSVLSRTVSKDRRSLEPSTVADLLLFKSIKKIDFV